MTIKKRMSKLYRSLGKISEKYIMPTIRAFFGVAIMYWLSSRVFAFVLGKTSSKGWTWLITVIALIVLVAIGAANDSAKAKADKERKTQNNVTRHSPKPAARPPAFQAGDAEYQYMRVPKF